MRLPLIKLPNPPLQNRQLLIDHRPHPRIRSIILQNQIAAVESPRDNLHRHCVRALQRPARPELARDARCAPRIGFAVRVKQALGGARRPAVGVLVEEGGGLAEGGAVEALRGGEEEGALALPVGVVDGAGDDGFLVGGGAAGGC
jgi:hypothetical protein